MASQQAPARPAAGLDRLGPFRHRPFALYWASGFVSNLGTWLQTVAASVFVYERTGSAFAVGILGFAGFAPALLFSVAGGVIADRYDRRRVIVISNAASLAVAAALAWLTLAGVATEVPVIVAAFAINTLWSLSKPALIALIPALVPRDEVQDATGLNALQFILGQIAGPILATVILITAGAGWAFVINALTFVFPIGAALYLLRRGLGSPTRGAGNAAAGGAGVGAIGYVRDHPWVLALLTGVVATAAPLEIVRTLSPAFVSESLHEPESAAGIIVAAQSVGSAIGVSVFVPLRRRGWARRMTIVALLLQAAGIVGAALAPGLAVAAVAVAVIGFGFSLTFPVLTGTLQQEIPDAVRGRVLALHQTAHLGNRPITALAAGALAAVLGAQTALLGGLALIPIGVVAVRMAWRGLGAEPVPPTLEMAGTRAPGR